MVAATEATDHTVENSPMTAIWSHGQTNTHGLGYFYRPDEIKYHGRNRGVLRINFHGQLECMIFTLTVKLVGPRGSAVERQSLTSVLSPSCARPITDG